MKVLCDVHLPLKLVNFFIMEGVDAVHGSTILNGWNTKDKDFCKYADENDYVIISKDSDFRNSHFLQNSPRKLLKVNLGNISNDQLLSVFRLHHSQLVKVFENNIACVEINKEYITVLIR